MLERCHIAYALQTQDLQDCSGMMKMHPQNRPEQHKLANLSLDDQEQPCIYISFNGPINFQKAMHQLTFYHFCRLTKHTADELNTCCCYASYPSWPLRCSKTFTNGRRCSKWKIVTIVTHMYFSPFSGRLAKRTQQRHQGAIARCINHQL